MRTVRSYVLRQGRMTPGQTRAFAYWSQYGLKVPHALDWSAIFGREAKRILEIGFGMGDALLTLAQSHPEYDFIGIEVHPPGVGRCLSHAKKFELTNLRVFSQDALLVLESIPLASLDKVYLLFPDPWPKKRHHKRRIVNEHFVTLIAHRLKAHGQFHLATDWQPYADHMLSTLNASILLKNCFTDFAPQGMRPKTKFERRGEKLNHQIFDLVYERPILII